MKFTRGRVGERLDAREVRRLMMYTEEGEVVAPMPSRGRRGALTMEVLTRREALEKAVNELLAEVEKSNSQV